MSRWKRVSPGTENTGSEQFIAHYCCEIGVYADEVLQHYFSPSMAVIANIAAG
jgi:hypothetical protein